MNLKDTLRQIRNLTHEIQNEYDRAEYEDDLKGIPNMDRIQQLVKQLNDKTSSLSDRLLKMRCGGCHEENCVISLDGTCAFDSLGIRRP